MTRKPIATAPPLADAIRPILGTAGYGFVEPPILHDAELFLDLAGEDLRRRLFLTQSMDGNELCLRPDYTIPVCLHHLTSGAAARRADYAYLGPVFRQRAGETGEFFQAGVESIGRKDSEAADADILALSRQALQASGIKRPRIRIGDSGLFSALLDALALPQIWQRRLERAFGDPARLATLLSRLGGEKDSPPQAYAGVLAALDGSDHKGARRVVDDLLALAGVSQIGGRSSAEIAERFLEQARLESTKGKLPAKLIRRFLSIKGDPAEAAIQLAALATKEGLDLGSALARFDRRLKEFAAHGIAPEGMLFSAGFGRRLDYYTGFVFEMLDGTGAETLPLVGGGRYDRLLSLILTRDGSGPDIPAVGFALWLDRLSSGRRK